VQAEKNKGAMLQAKADELDALFQEQRATVNSITQLHASLQKNAADGGSSGGGGYGIFGELSCHFFSL